MLSDFIVENRGIVPRIEYGKVAHSMQTTQKNIGQVLTAGVSTQPVRGQCVEPPARPCRVAHVSGVKCWAALQTKWLAVLRCTRF